MHQSFADFSAATQVARLDPPAVWCHFAALLGQPRPSRKEAALVALIRQWAQARGLACETDTGGNLIIRKPASPGRETAAPIALQAHLDMVCEKKAESPHDFACDSIAVEIADGWLRAPHTTLGADNGIGVALILAVLADDTLTHPPLEALLTVDEEAGMGGARALSPGVLQARRLLNLDTEAWGQFFLGCAGGLDVDARRQARPEPIPTGQIGWKISLTGLIGGHSGVDIHHPRANAVVLLVRLMRHLEQRFPLLRLSRLEGGTARNAIPREASATFTLPARSGLQLQTLTDDWQAAIRQELCPEDAGFALYLDALPVEHILPAAEQAVWLLSLFAAPCGVRRMSARLSGVVETSNNIGIVRIAPEGGQANFMVRSLIDGAARSLADEIIGLFRLSGTEAHSSGAYPGWTPNPDSALLRHCQAVFSREFGAESSVQVIHAGLECGLIAAAHPGMDIVSFGPNIRGAHAPGEAVDIGSVSQCWDLLRALLRTA